MENNFNEFNNEPILNEQPVFFESDTAQEIKTEEFKIPEQPKNTTPKNKNALTVVLCVVLSLLIGTASSFVTAKYVLSKTPVNKTGNESSNQDDTNDTVNIIVDETVNSSVEAVAKKVTPSVVGIRTTAAVQNFFGGSSESTGEGSGVVYSKDGYIITNYHVIESAIQTTNSSIEVFLDSNLEKSYPATVVGYNISHDLAVIKIEKTDLKSIVLADSSLLKVGQYCVAVGAPGGLEYFGSVTNGIISGLNREISLGSSSSTVSLIQTNAAINPGNSGGALVNLKGELIGINSLKIVSENVEGMGFAIPTNTVIEICDKIIAKEFNPDPFIGVNFSETWTAARLKQYGYPVGAVVKSVVTGGPAYEGGIRNGDIITEFNGKQVEGYDKFADLLYECTPGISVSVKFYRSGRYYTSSITIGSNNSQ